MESTRDTEPCGIQLDVFLLHILGVAFKDLLAIAEQTKARIELRLLVGIRAGIQNLIGIDQRGAGSENSSRRRPRLRCTQTLFQLSGLFCFGCL